MKNLDLKKEVIIKILNCKNMTQGDYEQICSFVKSQGFEYFKAMDFVDACIWETKKNKKVPICKTPIREKTKSQLIDTSFKDNSKRVTSKITL
jgi:hypothetical protein